MESENVFSIHRRTECDGYPKALSQRSLIGARELDKALRLLQNKE